MAEILRKMFVCDAPGCSVERPGGDEHPEGWSGKVNGQDGVYPRNMAWYACSDDHIGPAILWVTKMAHERAWE